MCKCKNLLLKTNLFILNLEKKNIFNFFIFLKKNLQNVQIRIAKNVLKTIVVNAIQIIICLIIIHAFHHVPLRKGLEVLQKMELNFVKVIIFLDINK